MGQAWVNLLLSLSVLLLESSVSLVLCITSSGEDKLEDSSLSLICSHEEPILKLSHSMDTMNNQEDHIMSTVQIREHQVTTTIQIILTTHLFDQLFLFYLSSLFLNT